jgi:hypothetical protein
VDEGIRANEHHAGRGCFLKTNGSLDWIRIGVDEKGDGTIMAF